MWVWRWVFAVSGAAISITAPPVTGTSTGLGLKEETTSVKAGTTKLFSTTRKIYLHTQT